MNYLGQTWVYEIFVAANITGKYSTKYCGNSVEHSKPIESNFSEFRGLKLLKPHKTKNRDKNSTRDITKDPQC